VPKECCEKKDGIINHLTFTMDDVARTLEHLRRHEAELIQQQPSLVEKLDSRLALFWRPDGEKLGLFVYARYSMR
jgi:hypothetical protein